MKIVAIADGTAESSHLRYQVIIISFESLSQASLKTNLLLLVEAAHSRMNGLLQ